ncbi:MAG TPA: hydrogenase maturation protease [Candidatus Saccharimonadales bacterium]|nr:hydrogenase maturation protease [Candidatus Saccharimonadales bacterium]
MTRTLILACGNPLRGDDAVALHLARQLREELAGPGLTVHTTQQWTPELAEPLSHCELAIFLDASQRFSPGFVHCESVVPLAGASHTLLTHSCSPALLLSMSRQFYNLMPPRAFSITIGAQTFAFSFSLSPLVEKAIPEALARTRSIISGATFAPSVLRALSAQ